MKWNNFWVREDGKEYDEARRRSANRRAVIYYLVALYIGYLGYSIMKNRLTGDGTMSYPLAVIITLVFIISAAGIIWYATKQMKNEYEKSLIEETDKEEE